MAVNKNIRFYQPNDPYYYEVDNLPLTDLLNNDIALENRINALEDSLNNVGLSNEGAFYATALKDLKAYVTPASGTPGDFGKLFVQPGKFTARMQVPASRESGWRMMRDDDDLFNNTDFNGLNGLVSTDLTSDFVRESSGLGRTAVVNFTTNLDGTNRFVNIESFDSTEFNSAAPPAERLDLIFVRGSVAMDTDAVLYNPTLLEASIGIIKGAYFRTDSAGGVQTNGSRFNNPLDKLKGRMTGMAAGEIPAATVLPNYGSVPMPDDLANFAWHHNGPNQSVSDLANAQLTTGASFCLPIAYVRVPQGYQTGTVIDPENIIDIRPFLRTAELSYGERAAAAASVRPSGNNPFVTQTHLESVSDNLDARVSNNTNSIASVSGISTSNAALIAQEAANIDQLETDVYGTEPTASASSKNIEGRVIALENATGAGGGALKQKHYFLATPTIVLNDEANLVANVGTPSNPVQHVITSAFGGNASKLVAVQFRAKMLQDSGGALEVGLNVQGQGAAREVCRAGISGSGAGGGQINTFHLPVVVSSAGVVTVNTFASGANLNQGFVRVSLYIDGYIYEE